MSNSIVLGPDTLFSNGTASESAANQTIGDVFPGGGVKDSQGSPALNSGYVVQLRGGLNTYRVIAEVSGSGGIAIATGGVAEIDVGAFNYSHLVGASVVLDYSFSAAPDQWGLPRTMVVDIGTFQASGTFGGFASPGNAPCTYRIYGGASVATLIFIPNCTSLDDSFTFGDPASGSPGSVSPYTYGTAFSVTCPINNCIEYFYAYHGSTEVSAGGPFGASYADGSRFPVINVDTVAMSGSGGDLNFYGYEWAIAGDGDGGFDVTANAGDSISQYYSQYYTSWNGYSGIAPLSWFGDPATATITGFWFSPGVFPVNGPPIFNTTHRSYQTDENADFVP